MEMNLIAAALQHSAFEIVVEDDARLSAPVLKCMHMAAQEVLRSLIEEELQIEGPRVGQRHYEARQGASCPAYRDLAEVSPIHLSLVAGKRLQAQESFARGRTQASHGAPELNDAAGIATIPDHLVNARGAQPRVLIQGLADERQIRIQDGGV